MSIVSYCIKRNSYEQYRMQIPIDDDMLNSVILSLLKIINNIKINNYDRFIYKFKHHTYNLIYEINIIIYCYLSIKLSNRIEF